MYLLTRDTVTNARYGEVEIDMGPRHGVNCHPMPKSLVIVESPTKARTISSFLGPEAIVESSMGHIRDLPRSAAEIPAKAKGEDWARLGVDVDNDFEPLYVVPKERRSQVKKLRALLKDADELYLATDEDREGEAIAWHLVEVLKPKVPVKRMVFHEITRPAIEEAFSNPRDLDERLVSAQEARRILDRLYGYEVSPVLWKKGQQAVGGRAQSVAVRIVVERERNACARTRLLLVAGRLLRPAAPGRTFGATLLAVDERRSPADRIDSRPTRTYWSSTRSRLPHYPSLDRIQGEVGRVQAVPAMSFALDSPTGGRQPAIRHRGRCRWRNGCMKRVHHLADRLCRVVRLRSVRISAPDCQARRGVFAPTPRKYSGQAKYRGTRTRLAGVSP
jgi:hypothetical protein